MSYIGLEISPPFHENWDNVHCHECCIRNIVDYYEPHNSVTWNALDLMSGKVEGKATWPQKMSLEMLKKGYQLESIGLFNIKEMLDMGIKSYLIKTQGKTAAEWSISNSIDLSIIEKYCNDLLNHPKYKFINRLPTLDDIRDFLRNGSLIISMVNAKKLNQKEGYGGHFVTIYGIDDTYVYFHDPGLPAFSERKEKHAFFIEAATSPTPENWTITGYKYHK